MNFYYNLIKTNYKYIKSEFYLSYLVPHSPKKNIVLNNSGLLKNLNFLVKDMCHVKGFKASCGKGARK